MVFARERVSLHAKGRFVVKQVFNIDNNIHSRNHELATKNPGLYPVNADPFHVCVVSRRDWRNWMATMVDGGIDCTFRFRI